MYVVVIRNHDQVPKLPTRLSFCEVIEYDGRTYLI
jgi:hypothetical protein